MRLNIYLDEKSLDKLDKLRGKINRSCYLRGLINLKFDVESDAMARAELPRGRPKNNTHF